MLIRIDREPHPVEAGYRMQVDGGPVQILHKWRWNGHDLDVQYDDGEHETFRDVELTRFDS